MRSVFTNINAVKRLLDKGADVNAKDNNGLTAILRVSGGNYLADRLAGAKILNMLLEKGADINVQIHWIKLH